MDPYAAVPAGPFTQPWSSKQAVDHSKDETLWSPGTAGAYTEAIKLYKAELKKIVLKAGKASAALHESLQKVMQDKQNNIYSILSHFNIHHIPEELHEKSEEAQLDKIWLELHRTATDGVPGADVFTAPARAGRGVFTGLSMFSARTPVSVRPAALPAAFVSMPASMRPLPAVPDLVPVPAATRPSAAAALQPPNKRQRPESAPERDGVDIAEAAREFQRLLDFLSNLIAAGLPQEAARTKLAELGARFPELGARFPELHERYVSLVAPQPKRNRWGPPVAPATGGSRRRRRGSRRGSRSSRSSRRRGSRSRRGSRRGSRRRRLTRKL
jgi:hypothetical protein